MERGRLYFPGSRGGVEDDIAVLTRVRGWPLLLTRWGFRAAGGHMPRGTRRAPLGGCRFQFHQLVVQRLQETGDQNGEEWEFVVGVVIATRECVGPNPSPGTFSQSFIECLRIPAAWNSCASISGAIRPGDVTNWERHPVSCVPNHQPPETWEGRKERRQNNDQQDGASLAAPGRFEERPIQAPHPGDGHQFQRQGQDLGTTTCPPALGTPPPGRAGSGMIGAVPRRRD